MVKKFPLLLLLPLFIIGCAQEDKGPAMATLTKMDRNALVKFIAETKFDQARSKAVAIIGFRYSQKTGKVAPTIDDFTFFERVRPLLKHEDPWVRGAGISLLGNIYMLYFQENTANELRKQVTPIMCQIRQLILQKKNDPNDYIRYKVVSVLLNFPDQKWAYSEVKGLAQDRVRLVRKYVKQIKRNTEAKPRLNQVRLFCP